MCSKTLYQLSVNEIVCIGELCTNDVVKNCWLCYITYVCIRILPVAFTLDNGVTFKAHYIEILFDKLQSARAPLKINLFSFFKIKL